MHETRGLIRRARSTDESNALFGYVVRALRISPTFHIPKRKRLNESRKYVKSDFEKASVERKVICTIASLARVIQGSIALLPS